MCTSHWTELSMSIFFTKQIMLLNCPILLSHFFFPFHFCRMLHSTGRHYYRSQVYIIFSNAGYKQCWLSFHWVSNPLPTLEPVPSLSSKLFIFKLVVYTAQGTISIFFRNQLSKLVPNSSLRKLLKREILAIILVGQLESHVIVAC